MWEIYKKEFLELVRDRRTLIFAILLPTIIMPAIFGGVIFVADKVNKKAQNEELTYIIQNADAMPDIVKELEKQDKFKHMSVDDIDTLTADDIKAKVQSGEFKFALILPKQGLSNLAQGKQATVELHFNNASVTNKIYQRVKSAIDVLNEKHQGQLLAKFNISKDQLSGLMNPIDIKRVNTADNREDIGEKIGGLLPYVLMILILTGAMYPALDLGVGEKERGTLETLLLTPVSRTQIVLSKFLVIFSTGFLTVFLTLASLVIWSLIALNVLAIGVLDKLTQIIALSDVLLVFLMLAPVAAIFASLLLCASIYAKNFKEAQNYMSPIMMFSFIPIIFSILPGVQLDNTWAWVPLTNVALAIKEIVKGTIDYGMMGIIFLSTTIMAGILLYFCNLWFNRESVLFRS
ncbi:ABC transporter permease [Pleionea sediminis]|uniref:ABC transporter permease n=1 Tax=Pleionea sediminis TaxID=2569479 RepID=UPI0011871CBC|nr:ABC transporter permease [Pleionea sediminis]